MNRTDEKISQIIGFDSKSTYHRAWQVYKHGIPELIDAVDRKQLSIAKAATVSKLPNDQQLNFIQTKNLGVKLL